MSESYTTTLNKWVETTINSLSLPVAVVVERSLTPNYDSSIDTSNKIIIAPGSIQRGERLTRANNFDWQPVVQVGVFGITTTAAEQELLLLTVEQIIDGITKANPRENYGSDVEFSVDPLYDGELLRQRNVFQSIISFTFQEVH